MRVRSLVKAASARALLGSGLYRPLLKGRGLIVAFHRIDDRYPNDPITYGTEAFVSICRLFRDHFDVVSLPGFLDDLEAGRDMEGRLAITFDDGYLDNYAVAVPVLEELDLPATFFLATGFIGTTRVPWWDREAGIVSEWMDWEQVRELHRRGFQLGAHTVNHVDLGQVHGEEAKSELLDSKTKLETLVGGEIDLFAYPYGREDQLSDENRRLVKDLGFRCSPSCCGGAVRQGDDPYRLRRIPIDRWYRRPGQFAFDALRS